MENQTEKQVERIGNEVAKAVEAMKEAGQQGKEQRTDEPKPADTPKGKGKNSKKDEAAKLQEEIDRKTKELARCLAELERKKEISRNRSAFIDAMDKLEEAAEKLKEEDTFETKFYKLRFSEVGNYNNSTDVFSISNRFLLEEFIKFMRKKVQLKIGELEQLLISE